MENKKIYSLSLVVRYEREVYIMANIPYGSEVEFDDWSHCFVDGIGNLNVYRIAAPSEYYWVANDASFMNEKVCYFNDSNLSYAQFDGGITPPSLPSPATNKFTFTVWCKFANSDWSSNGATGPIYGIFYMYAPGWKDSRQYGDLCMGFYNQNDTVVYINCDLNNLKAKNSPLFTYTLPDESTKLEWHHYAMTNDCENIYCFVDGKMIYSQAVIDNGAFGLYHLNAYYEKKYINDYFIMKDVCLWTEDFEVPDAPLYEKFIMKNIGGSGWVPPTPPSPVTNILKVY